MKDGLGNESVSYKQYVTCMFVFLNVDPEQARKPEKGGVLESGYSSC